MKTPMKHRLLAVLLPLLLGACATSPTGRTQFMLISPETAVRESKQAYVSVVEQLDDDGKLLDDPLLADRVGLITGRLVTEAIKQFPRSARWTWSVALIDAPDTVNAWCMAGGRMAVYSGLFEKLQLTDDEFAQIMGHEISHALANHTAESMSIALGADLVGNLANSLSGGKMATATELAAMLVVELPNSRTAEREADQIGTELAALAGYEPEAAVTLWEKMEEEGGGGGSLDFLSTHPSPKNRREKLAEMVPSMQSIRPAVPSPPHPVLVIYDRL